jgi:uncharacterized phage protein (TIGR02220 family)
VKFTILGFNQNRLIEFGMDATDALILRYFVDFKDSRAIVKEEIEEQTYFWIKYDSIVKELPILNLKSDTVYRRLKNMSKNNILNHKTVKKNGIYSYFNIGDNYIKLISDSNTVVDKSDHKVMDTNPRIEESDPKKVDANPRVEKSDPKKVDTNPRVEESDPKKVDINPMVDEPNPNKMDTNPIVADSNPVPSGKNSGTLPDLNPEQKINLLKDKSTKDINNKYSLVISYLNKKADTNYKASTKKTQQMINSKFKEGFVLEDFYKVIDNKVSEWINTDMEKYLRPETLFGSKFEGYLNQKCKGVDNSDARERDFKKLQSEGVGFSV